MEYILSIITSMMPHFPRQDKALSPHFFHQDQVSLSYRKWKEQMSLQIRDLTQCPARRLEFYCSWRATIVKEIAHIHFTALTYLELGCNSIESVEGLARVQMEHIECVHLSLNRITSVRVIRKAGWPRLQTLRIENNYFGDANSLVQACFPQMNFLHVYSGKWKISENALTNLCNASRQRYRLPHWNGYASEKGSSALIVAWKESCKKDGQTLRQHDLKTQYIFVYFHQFEQIIWAPC